MSRKKHHRLILLDRGLGHVHRWQSSCSCGQWTGVGRRRKKEAVDLHRDEHLTPVRRVRPPGAWRKPTPHDQLPDVLR